MRTTIDAAGRLVIPKELRRRAGREPGMPLDVEYRDGRIEIAPAELPVKLVRKGRFLVAVSAVPVPELTHETVEATREAVLDERMP